MRLDALLADLPVIIADHARLDVEIAAVTADSRKVKQGTVFVAVRGARRNGLQFAATAVQQGAVAVVHDAPAGELPAALLATGATLLQVRDARAAVGPLAAALRGHPSRQVQVIGITGTNGKTTTAVLVAQLLNAAGFKAAALGTLGIWTRGGVRPGSLTTPEAEDLQAILAQLRDEGFTHVALEVSSHALDQHRVAGIRFAAVAWTNLSRDHLDYHGSLAQYATAKAALFRNYHPGVGRAFVNGDDDAAAQPWHEGLAEAWSLGEHPASEHQVENVQCDAHGLRCVLASRGKAPLPLRCALVGRHNVENVTTAVLLCRALGVADAVLRDAVPQLQPPRGRLETVPNAFGALVLVDYAHTPDALEKVLLALRPLVRQGGKLVAVFGCGGDRDRGKRPLMGEVAARLCNLSVATSDNPRSEDPLTILGEIEVGLQRAGAKKLTAFVPSQFATLGSDAGYLVEADREHAIRRAVSVLQAGDVLVIAGKGHETTQTIAGAARPFDDAEVAARWLKKHRAAHAAVAPVAVPRGSGFAFDGLTAERATGGTLLAPGAAWTSALSTDTRNVPQGAVFVALKGDRFDGNAFLAEALQAGAAGVVCARGHGAAVAELARQRAAFILEVDDTLVALGDLARDHRLRFAPLCVGVTGSNGKTTTKELIALALSPLGEVLATTGNHNNRIGVPLTVARLLAHHRAAVVEMGMSEPGEIAELCRIALPHLGIVTSIAEAHLQGMGSLAAIAHEKAALLRALPTDGVAAIPYGEPLLEAELAAVRCRVVRFGRNARADAKLVGDLRVDGVQQRFTAEVGGERVDVALPGLGVHLCHDALGALAVAQAAGVDLRAAASALSRYQPVGQRMLPSRIGRWLVLEDCYNANPGSMRSALDTLATLPRPRVAVLGSMLELGAGERNLHAQVGAIGAATHVDHLIAVGAFAPDYARGAREAGLPASAVHAVETVEAAAALVRELAPGEATILVKGSRGARMERVVAELRARLAGIAGGSQSGTGPAGAPGSLHNTEKPNHLAPLVHTM
jgi:murE/murF fusion protein